jgi:hypothetical protein
MKKNKHTYKKNEDVARNKNASPFVFRPKVIMSRIVAAGLVALLVFYSGILNTQPSERTRWYNEDLALFNVTYLPFSIDDPRPEKGVQEILDNHNVVTMDKRYKENNRGFYASWGRKIARGPIPNDKRVYIAVAEGKGHGVFAAEVLPAGELVSVYTGIRVKYEEGRDSTYQWGYKVTDKEGNRYAHLDIDSRLSGNIMRFVNDDPGGDERNCVVLEVWAGLG